MNIAPDDAVWELRLSLSDPLSGRYTLELHNHRDWTRAGPFTLRFPSPQYALRWLGSRIIEGSQSPDSRDAALSALAQTFISARCEPQIWEPMIDALFHADHPGPFLGSPWWLGVEPPFVDHNPMLPTTHLDQETLDLLLQVFVDIQTHRVVALRKQIGESKANVQFLWWQDDRFAPDESPEVGGGQKFLIYPVHVAYSEILGQMVRAGVSLPAAAAEFFVMNPHSQVDRARLTPQARAFLRDLLEFIDGRRTMRLGHVATTNLDALLAFGLTAPADDVASWLFDCMLSAKHYSLPWFMGVIEREAALEYEEKYTYEVLVGPDGSHIFALHQMLECCEAGDVQWKTNEDFWRVNGEWEDTFPDDLDEWRWIAETKRLREIPERVARINQERGHAREFSLALDVGDAIEIHHEYADAFVSLFDLPINVPVGITGWLATSPDDMCSYEPLLAAKDPRLKTVTTLLRAGIHDRSKKLPNDIVRPLVSFLVRKQPVDAGAITFALIGLLHWIYRTHAAGGNESEPELQVDEPIINPSDLIGTDRLIKFVAALIALTDDVVVINVETERYPDGVYVQLCREDDGALTIEAVSNKYLTPPLTPDGITALHALGWEDPHDEDLPNYVRYLEPEQTSPGEVSEILVRTLQLAYGTTPSDLHQFAPDTLVRSLLKGEHGPDFAMNPNLSDAQRGRLVLGLRFPHDLRAAGK